MDSPKKSLGQHWLHDDTSLQAMLDMAEIREGDTVLEIGPGLGTLTKKLLAAGAQVIAVEKDEKLAQQITNIQNAKNLQIISGDILEFDLTQLSAGYKVVANIPYYLTSHLVRILSESSNPPSSATLLVQKEVAERLAASPGQMSLLSVSTQLYFEPSLGPIVPARLFTPPPKVDSQIIRLYRRQKPLFEDTAQKLLFRIIKAGFSNRRKTLLNSLSAGLQLSKDSTAKLIESVGVDPESRAQTLSLDQWIKLADNYSHPKTLHNL